MKKLIRTEYYRNYKRAYRKKHGASLRKIESDYHKKWYRKHKKEKK